MHSCVIINQYEFKNHFIKIIGFASIRTFHYWFVITPCRGFAFIACVMAKRFTDTNKWRKDFIRGLQGAYKLLWIYILDECDHAGIWHTELDVAGLRLGFDYSEKTALEQFGERIIVFNNGTKWFIPDFIEFQYGKLNPENRAHKSVLELIGKYKLEGHVRGLQARKDKEQEKDMVYDKEQESNKINFSDLENTQWFESIIKMLNHKITIEKIYEYWAKFQLELTAKDDLYRTKEDYRKHFVSWLKIQVKEINCEPF